MTGSEEDSTIRKIAKHTVNSPLYVGYVLCKGVEYTFKAIAVVSDLVINAHTVIQPVFEQIRILTDYFPGERISNIVAKVDDILALVGKIAVPIKFLSKKIGSGCKWLSEKVKSWWW